MEIDDNISISKDELIVLLKKAYEEGCYGYIDLEESVVTSILIKFLAEQVEKQKKVLPGMKFTPYSCEQLMGTNAGQTYMDMTIDSSPPITYGSEINLDLRTSSENIIQFSDLS